MRRAIVFRGFVVTFVRQGMGAPVVDRCYGTTMAGTPWGGVAVHLTPWRRNRHGDRLMGQALCVGRVKRRG